MSHVPVLISQILPFLKKFKSGVVVDATFGAGGYTRAILEAYPNLSVIGFDQDDTTQPFVEKIKKDFPKRFEFIQDNFRNLKNHLEEREDIIAVVFDLGVSSMQIDQKERGFAYQQNGPLDMRMDKTISITAAEIVNTWDRNDLKKLFWKYGEEKFAPLIAANICHRREEKPFETTFDLRNLVERAAHSMKAVMRIFQALRIEVNDELSALEEGLKDASECLQKNGVLIAVSFHSLEDRIIKEFMIEKGKVIAGSRYLPEKIEEKNFKILTRKPLLPTEEEIENNQRARSAKLRVLERK